MTGRERERGAERRDWETDGDEVEATRLTGCMHDADAGRGKRDVWLVNKCGGGGGKRRGLTSELKPSKE